MRTARILFCGDRNWNDRKAIKLVMQRLATNLGNLIVIEGEAPGADSLARDIAQEDFAFKTEPYPADWDRFGRAAGPIRNKEMLQGGKPDGVVAFHNNIVESKGTANMIAQARKAGIPVWGNWKQGKALGMFIIDVRQRLRAAG